ncbi:MAG TPA: Gfo/Idh/MocA family oxidoreductase [Anaerolineales bacterium]|nr:Gfo/Idh/MocA family oxidoreductase [Anaerolineales bacterium]HLO29046.1 Gfo/Idh/MocA family oxidoreductase [Anaerolineales bacterium]
MNDHIRFAIIGTGKRSDYLYAPLLNVLKEDVEFVGVWGRSEDKARELGEKYHVPWFTDLDQMRNELQVDAAIVSVANPANGQIGRRVIELGLHALLETPIANSLDDADAIITGAEARNLKVEVAEQYYRRPMERLKCKLIEAGVFGRVQVAYNDFMGHGYHGMSLIRSYIGFNEPVISINGTSTKFSVDPHYSWISHTYGSREEEFQHAILHFANGALGIFNWSNIAYDSALRWQRSTRFFAERGMAYDDRLTTLTSSGKDPQPIEIKRYFHNIGGMETLSELVTLTSPEIVWRNPFRAYSMDDEMIAVADCLMSLVQAIREDTLPEYGPLQARLDQEITLAMYQSAGNSGARIQLPLQRESSRENKQ